MSTFLVRNLAENRTWSVEEAKKAVRLVHSHEEHEILLVGKAMEELVEFWGAVSMKEMLNEAGDVLETVLSYIYINSREDDWSREEILDRVLALLHAKRDELGDFTDGRVFELKRAKQ